MPDARDLRLAPSLQLGMGSPSQLFLASIFFPPAKIKWCSRPRRVQKFESNYNAGTSQTGEKKLAFELEDENLSRILLRKRIYREGKKIQNLSPAIRTEK